MDRSFPKHIERGKAWNDTLSSIVNWIRRNGPRIRAWILREILKPLVCIIFTGCGVLDSPALLAAKILPELFIPIPDQLVITRALAFALTAIVVTYYSYPGMCKAHNWPWLIRLVFCYCAGVLWPLCISANLVSRLKRGYSNWQKKRRMHAKNTTNRRANLKQRSNNRAKARTKSTRTT